MSDGFAVDMWMSGSSEIYSGLTAATGIMIGDISITSYRWSGILVMISF